MPNETFLDNIDFLVYGDKYFVVEKFCGFERANCSFEHRYGNYFITYYCKLNFSGCVCEIRKSVLAPMFTKEKHDWLGLRQQPTKCYSFLSKFGHDLMNKFKESNYCSGKSIEVIPDYVRWFAENTETTETLKLLVQDVEVAFKLIDKNKNKNKNKNKKEKES